MSDNLRRSCAIHSHLKQRYPKEPTGNLARHLKTLAALVCGIVGSKKVHLPAVASKVPDGSRRESRAKRFARFLQNKSVTPEAFFQPYAQALVASLPPGPLVLVMDGSVVGRGCMALVVSVLYECGAPAAPGPAGVALVLAGGQGPQGPLHTGAPPGTAGPSPAAHPGGAPGPLPGRRRVRRVRPAGRHPGRRLALRLPHRQERAPLGGGPARRDLLALGPWLAARRLRGTGGRALHGAGLGAAPGGRGLGAGPDGAADPGHQPGLPWAKPAPGTGGASASRPSSPTRRAGASTCATAA